MGLKLSTEELRQRLEPAPQHVEVERAEEAVARADDFITEQGSRPLASSYYLQELAEKEECEDGRFLTQVLESLEHEVGAIMFQRGTTGRELALVLTKLQEARHWAIEDGVKHNAIVVIDRRIFKVKKETDSETP